MVKGFLRVPCFEEPLILNCTVGVTTLDSPPKYHCYFHLKALVRLMVVNQILGVYEFNMNL